jgi:predicted amidohydrolase
MIVRAAAIAFPLCRFASYSEWEQAVSAHVRFAADAGAQLVVLPEYVTAALIALDPDWSVWTERWLGLAANLAQAHRLTLHAGTHVVVDGAKRMNRALIACADGRLIAQDKLHPTPWERQWKISGNERILLIDVAGAKVCVLTCYDIEFPEAARAAARAGAEILLVASWTDDRQGFFRVRHTAHARCIENSVYVVHAPLVGGLALPEFEEACGAAGILTPCDLGFPRDGLAAESSWNQPGAAIADLDLDQLRRLRSGGTVTPFADARSESMYRVVAG